MSLKLALFISFVMAKCVNYSLQSQDNVSIHVNSYGEEITVYGSATTWAVGTENLTFTHVYKTNVSYEFTIGYRFWVPDSSRYTLLCEYLFKRGICRDVAGQNCSGCSNNLSTEKTVTTNMLFPVMDVTMNQMRMTYVVATDSNLEFTIQQFTISECPGSVGKAQSDNVTVPCGYGCTSRFSCPSGYYNKAENSSLYRCTARSEWSPVPVCQQDPSTTLTSATVNNPSSSLSENTPETDSTPLANQSSRLTSAALIAAIGIVLMILYTIIALYGWKNKFVLDNVATLFVAKGVCVVSWLIAVGLLFGLPGDNSAYVAGTIVGILSLVGMIAILLLHIWKIKTKKSQKGIPGKEVNL